MEYVAEVQTAVDKEIIYIYIYIYRKRESYVKLSVIREVCIASVPLKSVFSKYVLTIELFL